MGSKKIYVRLTEDGERSSFGSDSLFFPTVEDPFHRSGQTKVYDVVQDSLEPFQFQQFIGCRHLSGGDVEQLAAILKNLFFYLAGEFAADLKFAEKRVEPAFLAVVFQIVQRVNKVDPPPQQIAEPFENPLFHCIFR